MTIEGRELIVYAEDMVTAAHVALLFARVTLKLKAEEPSSVEPLGTVAEERNKPIVDRY